MNLPKPYDWLNNEPGPQILIEALKLYGVKETPGTASNPVIMAWAKEVGVIGWYINDAVAWCGLEMGVAAKRAGFPFNSMLLSALAWAKWGQHVDDADASLGDVMVFVRTGGGHVALYIGESQTKYLVYGGNQSDMSGFTWVLKERLFAVRRCQWKISQPGNIRKIHLDDNGAVIGGSEA